MRTKSSEQAKRNLAIITSHYFLAIDQIQQNMKQLSDEQIQEIIKDAIRLDEIRDKNDPHFDRSYMLEFIESIHGKETRIVTENYFNNQDLLNTQKESELRVNADRQLNHMGIDVAKKATVLQFVDNANNPGNDSQKEQDFNQRHYG